MTALKELQMEQRIMELEAKLGEAAECIYQLTEMMEKQQKQIEELKQTEEVKLPHNVEFTNSVDARKYLTELGYTSISNYIFLNEYKTVRAEMDLLGFNSWEIKFFPV